MTTCEHSDCVSKLQRSKRKHKEVHAKNSELEQENKKLKTSVLELQNLNKDLQQQLLKTLSEKTQGKLWEDQNQKFLHLLGSRIKGTVDYPWWLDYN